MFLSLILISIVIGIIEGVPLARKKSWREFITMLSLIVIAILLGLSKLFDIPTPLEILGDILRPIGKAFFDGDY